MKTKCILFYWTKNINDQKFLFSIKMSIIFNVKTAANNIDDYKDDSKIQICNISAIQNNKY